MIYEPENLKKKRAIYEKSVGLYEDSQVTRRK